MNLLIDVVRRRVPLILIVGVLAALVPIVLALRAPDTYRATARLFVATAAQDVVSAAQGDLAAKSRVQTYEALAKGDELMYLAALKSGQNITAEQLAASVQVAVPPGTVLLDVSSTAGSPAAAAGRAQAVADQLVTTVQQAEQPLRTGQPSIGLLDLQPADAGVRRVPRLQPRPIAEFAVAGLLAGALVAILIPARVRLVPRRRHRVGRGASRVPAAAGDGQA